MDPNHMIFLAKQKMHFTKSQKCSANQDNRTLWTDSKHLWKNPETVVWLMVKVISFKARNKTRHKAQHLSLPILY